MCTVIQLEGYFGRTLDYERSFEESAVLLPRRSPLRFLRQPTLKSHYAMMGMASVRSGTPLFYEAMNEKGLFIAGLLFAGEAAYPQEGTLAPFEIIPWILGQCADLKEARERLGSVTVADLPFAPDLPNSPLHWMIADPSGAMVAEPTDTGLRLYDDPVGVLTNSPSFPRQLDRLTEYRHLTAGPQHPQYAIDLPHGGRGLGAIGLPGDFSSGSRFVRAAFLRVHLRPAGVGAMFQMMGAVAVPPGCLRLPGGDAFTRYTSCCDVRRGAYYYTTYSDPTPRKLQFSQYDLEGREGLHFPIRYAMI